MAPMAAVGKTHGVQILMRLGYGGARFFAVAPPASGPTVQDAVLARLRRGGVTQAAYALSFAARTDRGVHAQENWLSLRLRLRGDATTVAAGGHASDLGRAAVAALQQDSCQDGLLDVRAVVAPKRLMARNCAMGKHYRYAMAACAVDGAELRKELAQLQAAARALSGTVHVGWLAHPGALRRDADFVRADVVVAVAEDASAPGQLRVDVVGPGFVRHQVRYMVAALQAVQRGHWDVSDVAQATSGREGPLRMGLRGPACACGLTLMALWPEPAWQAVVRQVSQSGPTQA